MTFFTLLYHSGDDGAVVTPPPTVSGPGSVGGFEPKRKEIADRRNKKKFGNTDAITPLERYLGPDKGPKVIEPDALEPSANYEAVAARIEALAREASEARLKLEARALAKALARIEKQERILRERLAFLEDEEAIALLLLMS